MSQSTQQALSSKPNNKDINLPFPVILPNIPTGSSKDENIDKQKHNKINPQPQTSNHEQIESPNKLKQLSSEQDDEDEGFVPSKIIIKEDKIPKINILQQPNREVHPQKQFLPRYISEGIMRKEPPQCYRRFGRYDYCEQPTENPQEDKSNLEQSVMQRSSQIDKSDQIRSPLRPKAPKYLTPYDKFILNGNFFLVYSRYREHTFINDQGDGEGQNFAKNEIRLDCLLQQSEDQGMNPVTPTNISGTVPAEINYKLVKPFEPPQTISQNISSTKEKVLYFDSKFECGNLLNVYKHKNKDEPFTYSMFIQNDTNTIGYNQWFYFSVRNAEKGLKYHFKIVNFRKRHSFFKQGNRPVIFSLKQSQKKVAKSQNKMENSHKSHGSSNQKQQVSDDDMEMQSGYTKRAQNVKYERSEIIKSYSSKERYYQLSFDVQFPNDDDIYYISMGLPYSYSKLIHNINLYRQIAIKNSCNFEIQSIGKSISGNMVPCVTLWRDSSEDKEQKGMEQNTTTQAEHHNKQGTVGQNGFPTPGAIQPQNRPILLLIGRQHPGETWSSYLMDELLHEFSSSSQHNFMLENFVVKAIPMINVDGVIYGNFRCDLSGMDLNRTWRNPSAILHPQILSIKQTVSKWVQNGRTVKVALDLHGHSKDYNVFCYGAGSGIRTTTSNSNHMESSLPKRGDDQILKSTELPSAFEGKVLPFMFSELNQKFSWPNCSFGISRYKQHTARAVIYGIIKNANVLTIQSSFFGSRVPTKNEQTPSDRAKSGDQNSTPPRRRQVFEPIHFTQMSQSILAGMISFFQKDQFHSKCLQKLRLKLNQEQQRELQVPKYPQSQRSNKQKRMSLQTSPLPSQLKSKAQSTHNTPQGKAKGIKGISFNKSQDFHHVSSGSDSEPSGDEMAIEEKFEKILPKTLIKECIKEIQRQKNPDLSKSTISLHSPTKHRIKKAKKMSLLSNNKSGPKNHHTIDIIKEEEQTDKTKNTSNKKPLFGEPKLSQIHNKRLSQQNKTTIQRFKRLSQEEEIEGLVSAEIEGQRRQHFQMKEKPATQMIPLKLKNQSYEIFRDAYNATEKQHFRQPNNSTYTPCQPETEYSRQAKRRISNKKVGIYRQKPSQRSEQFPTLCVLSENKRKTQAQKFYNRRGGSLHNHSNQTIEEKNMAMMPSKTTIQTRTEAIKQLRDKNKNSMELVSKIWRDNFTRYGMAFSTFKITK